MHSVEEKGGSYCWFQNHGYNNAKTIALLQELFGENNVWHSPWPPRSPDLTPLNFSLWGFPKKRFYSNNPETFEEVKHNTEKSLANNDTETLWKLHETY